MPGDFPPWDRVYAFFRQWRDHGMVKEFHDRLRVKVREKLSRDAEPTAGVIDSQSVKAHAVVGSDSRGFDGGKLINGRKRRVVVDTLGLLLGVMVTAADTGDRAAARPPGGRCGVAVRAARSRAPPGLARLPCSRRPTVRPAAAPTQEFAAADGEQSLTRRASTTAFPRSSWGAVSHGAGADGDREVSGCPQPSRLRAT
jgi:transposase